jgi:peptidoglycan/xylan/chitin deacetylase (PgdA/CDA1 family)
MKTKVYFTVDTENSMGGAWSDPTLSPVPSDRRIHCRIDGVDHGIGWICQELLKRNFKATFFAEVFASQVFGEEDSRRWMGYLKDHGQDVQLHTHLNFHYYAQQLAQGTPVTRRTDDLARLEEGDRRRTLAQACDIFQRLVGEAPRVYRAGNWACSRALLADLRQHGIVLDSSCNHVVKGKGSFDDTDLQINALQQVDGMFELPVTLAQQSLPEPRLREGLRPLDPTSMSSWELRTALEQAQQAGMPHVVLVFHCFSFVKSGDDQYRSLKADKIVMNRFTDLLDHLLAHEDRFEVSTLGALAHALASGGSESQGAVCVPQLGFFHPLARKLVQIANRFT